METTAFNLTPSPDCATPGLPSGHNLTESEHMRSCREISSLVRQLDRPFAEIAPIYVDVYADLKSHAQVTDYLPIFVARKVRTCLERSPRVRAGSQDLRHAS